MNLLLLASAVVPTVILLWMFLRNDEFPEPRGVVLMSFFLGGMIGPVLLLAQPVLKPISDWLATTNPYAAGAGAAFLLAAVPEETLKYLVLRGYAVPHREFDEPMDGIVYGVTISLGFATVENILYVIDGGYGVALARAVTAVPCHAMLGAVMGYYAGRGAFAGRNRRKLFTKALALPILLHGLYDMGPLIWRRAGQMDVDLPLWAELLIAFIFINALTLLIHTTSRATGILMSRQRMRRIPRFLFSGARGVLVRSSRRTARDERANVPPVSISKVLAVIFICGACACFGGLAVLLIVGKAGIFEICFLGCLAALFGLYATNHLADMNATLFTELEHVRGIAQDKDDG